LPGGVLPAGSSSGVAAGGSLEPRQSVGVCRSVHASCVWVQAGAAAALCCALLLRGTHLMKRVCGAARLPLPGGLCHALPPLLLLPVDPGGGRVWCLAWCVRCRAAAPCRLGLGVLVGLIPLMLEAGWCVLLTLPLSWGGGACRRGVFAAAARCCRRHCCRCCCSAPPACSCSSGPWTVAPGVLKHTHPVTLHAESASLSLLCRAEGVVVAETKAACGTLHCLGMSVVCVRAPVRSTQEYFYCGVCVKQAQDQSLLLCILLCN